ncbi:hypothetical protein FOA52_012318 [Chlamydomonas sp. UWO 241]|nr:hypothetical protein FOA52_012318 [Chlamydomonas sp. UWO 241]
MQHRMAMHCRGGGEVLLCVTPARVIMATGSVGRLRTPYGPNRRILLELAPLVYPYGNTAAQNVVTELPRGDAKVLLIGCGDVRNALMSLAATDRGTGTGSLQLHLSDAYPSVLARAALLLHLCTRLDPSSADDMRFLWAVWYNALWNVATHARFCAEVDVLVQSMGGSCVCVCVGQENPSAPSIVLEDGTPGDSEYLLRVLRWWAGPQGGGMPGSRQVLHARRAKIELYAGKETASGVRPKGDPVAQAKALVQHVWNAECDASTPGVPGQMYRAVEAEMRTWYTVGCVMPGGGSGAANADLHTPDAACQALPLPNHTLLDPFSGTWNVHYDLTPFDGCSPFTAPELLAAQKAAGSSSGDAVVSTAACAQLSPLVARAKGALSRSPARLSLHFWWGDCLLLCATGGLSTCAFHFIDTSNVADHVGLLNMLGGVLPARLARHPLARLRTESMLWTGFAGTMKDYLDSTLGLPQTMHATLLGVRLVTNISTGRPEPLLAGMVLKLGRMHGSDTRALLETSSGIKIVGGSRPDAANGGPTGLTGCCCSEASLNTPATLTWLLARACTRVDWSSPPSAASAAAAAPEPIGDTFSPPLPLHVAPFLSAAESPALAGLLPPAHWLCWRAAVACLAASWTCGVGEDGSGADPGLAGAEGGAAQGAALCAPPRLLTARMPASTDLVTSLSAGEAFTPAASLLLLPRFMFRSANDIGSAQMTHAGKAMLALAAASLGAPASAEVSALVPLTEFEARDYLCPGLMAAMLPPCQNVGSVVAISAGVGSGGCSGAGGGSSSGGGSASVSGGGDGGGWRVASVQEDAGGYDVVLRLDGASTGVQRTASLQLLNAPPVCPTSHAMRVLISASGSNTRKSSGGGKATMHLCLAWPVTLEKDASGMGAAGAGAGCATWRRDGSVKLRLTKAQPWMPWPQDLLGESRMLPCLAPASLPQWGSTQADTDALSRLLGSQFTYAEVMAQKTNPNAASRPTPLFELKETIKIFFVNVVKDGPLVHGVREREPGDAGQGSAEKLFVRVHPPVRHTPDGRPVLLVTCMDARCEPGVRARGHSRGRPDDSDEELQGSGYMHTIFVGKGELELLRRLLRRNALQCKPSKWKAQALPRANSGPGASAWFCTYVTTIYAEKLFSDEAEINSVLKSSGSGAAGRSGVSHAPPSTPSAAAADAATAMEMIQVLSATGYDGADAGKSRAAILKLLQNRGLPVSNATPDGQLMLLAMQHLAGPGGMIPGSSGPRLSSAAQGAAVRPAAAGPAAAPRAFGSGFFDKKKDGKKPAAADAGGCDPLQLAAIKVLGRLVFRDRPHQATLAAAGVIPPLAALLLEPGPPPIVAEAVDALSSLAFGASDLVKAELAAAVPGLVHLLASGDAPCAGTGLLTRLHMNVTEILMGLADSPQFRGVVMASGAVPHLVQLLSGFATSIYAASILFDLGKFNKTNQEIILAAGAREGLVQAILSSYSNGTWGLRATAAEDEAWAASVSRHQTAAFLHRRRVEQGISPPTTDDEDGDGEESEDKDAEIYSSYGGNCDGAASETDQRMSDSDHDRHMQQDLCFYCHP